MKTVYEKSLELHELHRGKLEIKSKVEVKDFETLALAYSPGVAQACLEIKDDLEKSYVYTNRANMVAVVSDGSAVLGLGNIGAEAAMPVMEGKAVLFKSFANIDAIPLCINTQDVEGIISFVKALEPSFGGILLEDICAPKCIEIERRLKKEMNIPVFHDDQHGTAIITVAAIINYLKLTNKQKENIRVVVSGAGAAGSSIIKLMYEYGIRHIDAFDLNGHVNSSKIEAYDQYKKELLEITNLDNNNFKSMKEAMVNADIFVGVSAPNIVTKEMVASMNDKAAVFAMANPTPEIMPELALEAGAYVVGTGRSDYPNQINNVLAFPGLFRGALDGKATKILEEMKLATAYALAELVKDSELRPDYIIPSAFDPRVVGAVSSAVKKIVKEKKEVRS
ncbi:MAG: NADP-dependent malic enzyme [Anaerorhabdus sp.]